MMSCAFILIEKLRRTFNGRGFSPSSYIDYKDYCVQNKSFIGLAAESKQFLHLGVDGIAERIKGAVVSANYFDVLGVKSIRGRLLLPSDDKGEGTDPVVVISERLWRNRFNSETNIIGKSVSLNSHIYSIVGVAMEFKGTSRLYESVDVWVPPVTMWHHSNPGITQTGIDLLKDHNSNIFKILGRLKLDVDIEHAQAEMTIIAQRFERPYQTSGEKPAVRLSSELAMSPGDRKEIGQLFTLQFGIMMIAMLIACASVGGLILTSMVSRQKEVGIRIALGAGRWRVMRQLLIECILLAILGGVLALLVALGLTNLIRNSLPFEQSDLKEEIRFTIDWTVLFFTLGLAVLAGLLFGFAPTLRLSRSKLNESDYLHGKLTKSHFRMRSTLVIAQLALSVILLTSAGLFLRTIQNSYLINPGYNKDNLFTIKFDLTRQNYTEEQGQVFYQRVIKRMSELSGIQAVSFASNVPLQRSIIVVVEILL